MKFVFKDLGRSIGWRPIASYFILIAIFFIVLKLSDVTPQNALGAVLLTLPFAALLAWIFFIKLLMPLVAINEAAREMARGNLDLEIDIATNDEIGDLAKNINYLARRLKNTIVEITEEKDRMRAVLNSMADGVVAVDIHGRVLLINPVVEKVLKITESASKGKVIVGAVRHQDFVRHLITALETQQELSREIQVLNPEPKIFRVHFTPLKGTERGGVVALLRDVTEKKMLEQMRSEFIANVSHELRTPLTSINGFLETLLDGAIEERETANNFLTIMHNEAQRLSRLIEDLFALSNIENKKVIPKKGPVDIIALVEKVIKVFSITAKEKGVEIIPQVDPGMPVYWADEDMLTRVLINLMDNAIKYTPRLGRVSVRAALAGDEVAITVADTGVGIDDENLPRIFERLYRVDRARSREFGGAGLGLAIVKHIVEAHGGRIGVDSSPNHGTRFTVSLPLQEVD